MEVRVCIRKYGELKTLSSTSWVFGEATVPSCQELTTLSVYSNSSCSDGLATPQGQLLARGLDGGPGGRC
jgi:hypothetical protein